MTSKREHPVAVVVHGHFYQPPRENPWTHQIPLQESAAPYHDWNERILAECYRPNTASRVLDAFGRIRTIVNNFEFSSFNVGPTLMSWLQEEHPDVYERILDADRVSCARYSGHGNALAQVYNHMIMPLANDEDRLTQVIWGLEEFRIRYARAAEGIWLAETAIDQKTVDTLIDCGVRFTILAPEQAARVRDLDGGEWHEVAGARIDPKMPYRVYSSPGSDGHRRSLDVFFYDGPISRALAFESLLSDSNVFADRLKNATRSGSKHPQVVSVGVDGETFGHHFAFGDMCLAAFYTEKAQARGFQVSNYAAYLAQHPPTREVELATGPDGEGSAWSCAHGVGRWIRDCGCQTGGAEHWNQAWRGPLRQALDYLRDEVREIFQQRGNNLFHDAWSARNDYVGMVVQHGKQGVREAFLKKHLRPGVEDRVSDALTLLEAQRQAMAMYTSCAWFFADISGIETLQNLRYAARCIQLMQPFAEGDLESAFLKRLRLAKSNLGKDDGATLYLRYVKPDIRSPEQGVAARAFFRLLQASRNRPHVYGFAIRELARKRQVIHGHESVCGHVWLRDEWTLSEAEYSYVALQFGARDLRCFVSRANESRHRSLGAELEGLSVSSTAALEEGLTRIYGHPAYRIDFLTVEQRRRIAERLATERVSGLRHHFRAVFEDSLHLLQDYADMALELPEELRAPCEFTLQADLVRYARALRAPFAATQVDRLVEVVKRSERLQLPLDLEPLKEILEDHLERQLHKLWLDRNVEHFGSLENLLGLVDTLQVSIQRACAEEVMFDILRRDVFTAIEGDAQMASEDTFVVQSLKLAQHLNFATDEWWAALGSSVPTP